VAPYIYALIIMAFVALGATEVLVARQKREMKRQFLEELDGAPNDRSTSDDSRAERAQSDK
jgi:hypothetical protein